MNHAFTDSRDCIDCGKCHHVEVRKLAHGVTLREPCLKPRAEHSS